MVMNTNDFVLISGLWFVLCVVVYVIFVCQTSKLAQKLGRDIFTWTVCAIFMTPVFAILMLHCLGRTEKKIKEDFFQELQWEQDFERKVPIKEEGE